MGLHQVISIEFGGGASISMWDHSVIRLVWFFSLGAVWLGLATLASAQSAADQHVKVELISEQDAIVPHRKVWVGIRFVLQDEWHTYWVNPGDSGEPPRIEWELPEGFQAGAMQWPYPERLSTPPFADFGYEHELLLIAAVQPPPALKRGVSQRIAARVHYLVCRDICIPGQKRLELTLPVKSRAVAGSDVQLFEATRRRLPQPAPESWKISAVSMGDDFVLNLKIGRSGAPRFFPLEEEQIENAAPQTATTIPGGFRLHLKKSRHLLKPLSRLRGVLVVGPGKAYLLDVSFSQPPSNAHARSMNN
jgi:DsbC/DsbD-like thiol-disulfide interchange protein